ncbi:unnamed protein product [Effrenium voratum]|nr:unnamed protein product [Effrenium voratum]
MPTPNEQGTPSKHDSVKQKQYGIFFFALCKMFREATLHCTDDNIRKEGEAGKIACTVDVSGLVGAVTFASSGLLFSIAGCPALLDKDNSNLFCAAAIIDTVGLVAYFAQAFASISTTCGALHP